MMAGLSEPISVGQWFRVVTGVIEVAGAIALFIRASVHFAAAVLAMAALTRLLIIGGSAVPARGLMALAVAIVWLHRAGCRDLRAGAGSARGTGAARLIETGIQAVLLQPPVPA